MIKEYIFKVVKEQYVKVYASNVEDALDLAEEDSFLNPDEEEIVDVILIDEVEEEDYER